MPSLSQISTLKQNLSSDAEILNDSSHPKFQEYLQRWTDINKQTPFAIILPTAETDIQKTVQWAISTSTPFVAKSGGNSEWSTIAEDGIIIDLSHYSGIEFDEISHNAVLKGSIRQKEVAVYLAEKGLFTALGNGNAIGAIPYMLNGGVPITASITGFGCDQIISARLVTAQGDLIDVNEKTNPDLLYAIRGAGQHFGLVTQVVVKTYPLSDLGNDQGVLWIGTFIYPVERANEVCSAVKTVMNDERYNTSGSMIIASPPPAQTPSIIISVRLTGDPKNADKAFGIFEKLNPTVSEGQEVPLQNASDGRAAFEARGGLKHFSIAGLPSFEPGWFLELTSLYQEMVEECPDAKNSAFNFQWDSRSVPLPCFESAMSHHGIRFWQNNIFWYSDPSHRSRMDAYDKRATMLMRGGHQEADWIDYQNSTRDGPVENRFKGEDRLARLRMLKREWDPMGVFTREFLG